MPYIFNIGRDIFEIIRIIKCFKLIFKLLYTLLPSDVVGCEFQLKLFHLPYKNLYFSWLLNWLFLFSSVKIDCTFDAKRRIYVLQQVNQLLLRLDFWQLRLFVILGPLRDCLCFLKDSSFNLDEFLVRLAFSQIVFELHRTGVIIICFLRLCVNWGCFIITVYLLLFEPFVHGTQLASSELFCFILEHHLKIIVIIQSCFSNSFNEEETRSHYFVYVLCFCFFYQISNYFGHFQRR